MDVTNNIIAVGMGEEEEERKEEKKVS